MISLREPVRRARAAFNEFGERYSWLVLEPHYDAPADRMDYEQWESAIRGAFGWLATEEGLHWLVEHDRIPTESSYSEGFIDGRNEAMAERVKPMTETDDTLVMRVVKLHNAVQYNRIHTRDMPHGINRPEWEAAKAVIDLIRDDERKWIAEKLMSDEVVFAVREGFANGPTGAAWSHAMKCGLTAAGLEVPHE